MASTLQIRFLYAYAMQQSCTISQDNRFFSVDKEEKEQEEEKRGGVEEEITTAMPAVFHSNAAELYS